MTNGASLDVRTTDDSSPLSIDKEREQAYRARRSSLAVSRRHCRETGSEDRFCYTAPQWPRADLPFVAWIHPLNLASAVLSFKSPAFGRTGHHVAGFSRSPRRRQGSRFARPAARARGLTTESVERTPWLLRQRQANRSIHEGVEKGMREGRLPRSDSA